MLELRFFGVGQASYAGRPLPGFPHQQPYLLIIYLLLNPEQVHSREQLAALFWGDYPTATSRKYLRNALWRARHLLESVGAPADTYLRVYDEGVGFGQVGPYTLDVEIFEQITNRHRAVTGRDLLPDQAGGECLQGPIDQQAGPGAGNRYHPAPGEVRAQAAYHGFDFRQLRH